MPTALVTTTIHVPELLEGYCANARRYGHEDLVIIVVGDKKTPAGVGAFCQSLQHKWGYEVEFYDVAAQHAYLADYPSLRDYLPYNSVQRRNVGLLRAYRLHAKTIITIDDDNHVEPNDNYFGWQKIVGTERPLQLLSSSNGWYNICDLLEEEHKLPFYPRGWPIRKRWVPAETSVSQRVGKVVVNAGLWLEAPDIDAVTWLDLPIRTTAYRSTYLNGIALDINTWAPFNSQNTALANEVLPAYFLSPYVGRYDDIWASYVVKKIADHLGHYVHFGPPIVRQKRNLHNYFRDFDLERLGLETTDQFVDSLISLNLQRNSYVECFIEVIDWIKKNKSAIWQSISLAEQANINRMVEGMKIWHEALANEPARIR